MGTISLDKIHEDLEFLKKAISEIKIAISLDSELREEIKERVAEARKRMKKGDYISNEDIIKEFDV